MAEMKHSDGGLIDQLKAFIPFNEQEMRDREVILDALLKHRESIFLRTSLLAHMTASAWVISPDAKQVLMAYHKIYDAWSWLGGHADGDTDLMAVALREVREESGLEHVIPATDKIYSVETLTVDGHEKKGVYVPSHLHLNVTYLLMADPSDPLRINREENSGVQWYEKDAAVRASSEIWFRERIYTKLNQKLDEGCIRDSIASAGLRMKASDWHSRESL